MENKINKHNHPQKKPRNTPKTKQKKNGKNNPPPQNQALRMRASSYI